MNERMLWSGLGCLSAAVLLGVVLALGGAEPPAFDTWWNQTVAGHRADWMVGFGLVMNTIGGGWVAVLVVPALLIAALLLVRRWREAVLAALCLATSAGAVQLLKHLFGRARPEDMIVASDFGSFPSGHAANAATVALLLCVIFPRVWVMIAGGVWIVAMALSRTFLSVHWASDTIGGALVGAGVVLVVAAVMLPWVRPSKEQAPLG